MVKILVVDDEESDRILIGHMLASGGYEPIYARDGREALRVLDRVSGLAAMVTDLRMPYLNGLQLIRNRREAGDSIPVIAISGVDAIQLSVARDYGARATLTKPLDRDELLKAVQSALDSDETDWDGVWISYHAEARFGAP